MLRKIAFVVTVLATPVSQALAQRPAFSVMEATIDDIRGALESGHATCQSVVRDYFDRVEAYDKSGPGLNAVQTVNRRALEDAERLDSLFRASGPVGPLHCVPVLVKDQVETSDMPTMYGSVLFKDFIPKRDATIVLRLKNAGAVIVAKTTMGEFASGYLGAGRSQMATPSGSPRLSRTSWCVVGRAETQGGFDYRRCAFAPRAHQGYRVEMNTRRTWLIAVRSKRAPGTAGALARAAGLMFTGWPGGWLRR